MDYVSYECLGRNGRLGNMLWQIASTVGIAHGKGKTPAFPTWEYQPYFRVPDWMFYDELPPATDREDLGTAYLQDLEHFACLDTDYDPQITSMFQPSELTMSQLYDRYPSFWTKAHTTAVHVRRGDYVSLPQHFPLPTMTYFRRARDIVVDRDPDSCFLIFSDDPDWCQEQLDPVFGDYDHEFVIGVPRPVEIVDREGEPEDQFDMALMTFADRHIISNSTFSWWGAYLSQDTEIIYPSVWFGKHKQVRDIPWRRMFNDRFREVGV